MGVSAWFLECKEVDCEGISAEGRHFSMVCGGKGWNHDQLCTAELLKVEKARANCREFQEEL